MIIQQEKDPVTIQSLMAQNAFLESSLAEKNSVILGRDTVISGKDTVITKLTADLELATFQYEQLQRMIFGSKRERFISTFDSEQLTLEFEPKVAEIDAVVKAERELIRVAFLRTKPKKEHQGRMALPAHLPVVEYRY